MEISSIAGVTAMLQSAQTEQGISTKMLKNAADQQKQMANMLAQNAKNLQQTSGGNGYSFSTYA